MTTSTRKATETAQSLIRFEDSSGIGRAAGGTTGGELYVTTSGSLSASIDTHLFGSGSTGWKPLAVKLAEDGSGDYALKVDTELVLSGNITVTNIKGYSTDGTSGSLVYGKASSDGTVWVTGSVLAYENAKHDLVAGSGGFRIIGTGYSDPTSLPADISADGDDARVATSRKGEVYVYPSRLGSGEDSARARMLVEERTTQGNGGILTGSGTAHNTSCRVASLMVSEISGSNPIGITLRDGGAAGSIMTPKFMFAAGRSDVLDINMSFATDVYAVVSGSGTVEFMVNVHTSTVL